MATKIAINGFGRIGRAFFRAAQKRSDMDIVAVNDLTDTNALAYLLQYDSVYGRAAFTVTAGEGKLVVEGKEIAVLAQKEPAQLPWAALRVDIVVESTGFFTTYEKAKAHLDAGAKRVVITAPAKGDPVPGVEGATILMGLNEEKFPGVRISSNASCTTNAASPVIAILHEAIGIEKAVLSTTHAYTASQSLVDGPSKEGKDPRAGRAAAHSIIPSSTGAAIAVTKALPELEWKFDGISLRVPVLAGSIADITFIASRDTTAEEVNAALKAAALQERWSKTFSVTEEPLVSSDIVGSPYASIADLGFTKVVDGNLVKVLAWYDNEAGYTHSLVAHVAKLAEYIE